MTSPRNPKTPTTSIRSRAAGNAILVALIVIVILAVGAGLGLYFLQGPRPAKSPSGRSDATPSASSTIVETFVTQSVVVTHDSGGIFGARVVAYRDAGNGFDTTPTAVAQCDDRGVAALSLPTGVYRFETRAEGYGASAVERAVSPDPEPITVVLTPGRAMTGYVTDANGLPIADATIVAKREPSISGNHPILWAHGLLELEELRTAPPHECTSTTDGYFELSGLKDAPHWVQVTHDGYSEWIQSGVTIDRSPVAVQLAPSVPLELRIVDAAGAPIGDAHIEIRARMRTGVDLMRTLIELGSPTVFAGSTDAQGKLSCPRCGGSPQYSIRVTAPRFQPLDAVADRDSRGLELELTLQEGHEIQGVVLGPDDQPLPGARVRVHASTTAPNEAQPEIAETDERGAFHFDTLPLVTHTVAVMHPEFATTRQSNVLPDAGSLTLRLSPGAVIAGRVVDSRNGEPLRAATVSTSDPSGIRRQVVTDGAGRFRMAGITANSDLAMLTAHAPGYAQSTTDPLTARVGEETNVGDLTLERCGSITGTVWDANGSAVAGALILAVGPGREGAAGEAPHSRATRSSADGRFVIDEVYPDSEIRLLGVHSDFLLSRSLPFAVQPGEAVVDRELVLSRGGQVSGLVRDRDGNPIVGATVAVQPGGVATALDITTLSSAVTDSTGRFLLAGLATGAYSLIAEAEGYFAGTIEGLDVVAGTAIDWIELTLQRGHWISGRVTGVDGTPIAGAEVRVTDTSDGFRRLSQRTDANGGYRLEPLGEYPVDVRVTAKGYAEAERTEQRVDTGDVDFALNRPGVFRGRVVDLEGDPITSFGVKPYRIFGEKEILLKTRSFQSRTGFFEIDDLPGGYTYRLLFGAPGCGSTDEIVDVVDDTVTQLGEIRIERGKIAKVRVIDELTGEPISQVKVSSLRVGAFLDSEFDELPASSRNTRRSVTDREGRCEVGGIAIDPVPLLFTHLKYSEQVVELGTGDTETDVFLSPGGWISGTVRSAYNAPMAGLEVRCTGSSRDRVTNTSSRGTFTFEGLEPGNYAVIVRLAGGGKRENARFGASVVSGEETVLVCRLPAPDKGERGEEAKDDKARRKGDRGDGRDDRGRGDGRDRDDRNGRDRDRDGRDRDGRGNGSRGGGSDPRGGSGGH
ncbi:MAG: carboxypeptidase regulatory-like domain-containing protein [Planctomycetes bacterium]|nr:carboxypeptidase regulatory-like domain-containing protein [Planctomycetota bacterium]